ncbi:MAG TPA: acetyl-CoA C-acyltransferase, partial [Candidatus Acidoferrum sp.]|nr:acetyl-CoA C-acyltransferase [Candidatus Acidoferrum sp.]
MFPTDVVILAGARTPMARYTGAFKDISANELGAIAAREAIRRAGVDPGEFDHAIFGSVMQTSADALYGARHVALKAGLKVETPAVTVNRLCGSGIESIAQAAQRILLREASLVLAGGMENMTQAPHVIRGARTGFRLGEGRLEDSLMTGLTDTYCGFDMAGTAENVAAEYGITRRASDEYALRSQQAAEAAYRAGRMREEIIPVEIKKGGKSELFAEDDHRRPDTTIEILEKLKPAFRKDGIVTAGNASGIVDGGAAVVVTHAKTARERNWKPLGR